MFVASFKQGVSGTIKWRWTLLKSLVSYIFTYIILNVRMILWFWGPLTCNRLSHLPGPVIYNSFEYSGHIHEMCTIFHVEIAIYKIKFPCKVTISISVFLFCYLPENLLYRQHNESDFVHFCGAPLRSWSREIVSWNTHMFKCMKGTQ